jgi:hypothetical protein
MALPERFSLLHSELNGFLFADMGTEENGAPLSVLSGLTRLGIDPWVEGARLAKLPQEAAAHALTPLIALFRKDRSEAEVRALAAHLAELLPRPAPLSLPAIGGPTGVRETGWRPIWLFCFGLVLLLITMAVRGSLLWP